MMNTKELYKLAIKTFGKDAQILMAIEEMAELMVELSHLIRKKYDNFGVFQGKLSEEIADVQIMTEQIIEMHKLGSLVIKAKESKLKMLEERINEYNDDE